MIADHVGADFDAEPLLESDGQLNRHRRIEADPAEFRIRIDIAGGAFEHVGDVFDAPGGKRRHVRWDF